MQTDLNPQIRAASAPDIEAICRIYNQGIGERIATFETRLRNADDIQAWLDQSARYPLLVICDAAGDVRGWAGLSAYRPRECYASIAEFSIYLDSQARGQGQGQRLLQALIESARSAGFSKLVSRIFTFNHASLALCRHCGFREVGVYQKHGQLDGQWLDVVIVERWLGEPAPAFISAPANAGRPTIQTGEQQ